MDCFFQTLINGAVTAIDLGKQIQVAVSSNGLNGFDSSLLGVAEKVVAIVEQVQQSPLEEKGSSNNR